MNFSLAESHATRAEMWGLTSSEAQFISSADSKPVHTIKQDAMITGYLYTRGWVPVSRCTFMDACCVVDDWPLDLLCDRMTQIRNTFKWLGLHQKEVVRLQGILERARGILKEKRELLKELKIDLRKVVGGGTQASYEQLKKVIRDLKKELAEKEAEDIDSRASDNLLYTGYGLLSMLFPADFEYTYHNQLEKVEIKGEIVGMPVKVVRGVMIGGTLNLAALMHMIHLLYKDYGAVFGCDFITYYQRMMHLLIGRRGFSCGLEDCTPKDDKLIRVELEKSFLQAKEVMETEPDLELRESKVLHILNEATNIGERIVRQGLDPENNFIHMIVSGSKGKMFNYVNAVSSVGQQNLGGKRAPKDYGGRTLPSYVGTPGDQYAPDVLPVNDVLSEFDNLTVFFQSRGFVFSSFYKGLSPQEFFFLSAGGREGLTDTSVKTAKCGYISRRILKVMEDLKVAYNGSVVNSKGTVVQFVYGDDNFSAAELVRTDNFGYQCSDICHIVNMLNSDHEWDEFEQTLPKKAPKASNVIVEEPEDLWDQDVL